MKDKLGVLLMEDFKGDFSVQLYTEPEKVVDAFRELKGKPHDKTSRATYLQLWYENGEVKVKVEYRDLPVVGGDIPDGYRIGEGPFNFPVVDKGEKKNG